MFYMHCCCTEKEVFFFLFLGTAVVLRTKAALWTDGRYYLAAEDELDCNWILMKSGWYYETFKQMVDFFL